MCLRNGTLNCRPSLCPALLARRRGKQAVYTFVVLLSYSELITASSLLRFATPLLFFFLFRLWLGDLHALEVCTLGLLDFDGADDWGEVWVVLPTFSQYILSRCSILCIATSVGLVHSVFGSSWCAMEHYPFISILPSPPYTLASYLNGPSHAEDAVICFLW